MVSLDEIKEERLVLFTPMKASVQIVQVQGPLIGERAPSEFYFCDSAEAITVLVNAGYGISILPVLFAPHISAVSKVPIEGLDPVSFGVYYKSL